MEWSYCQSGGQDTGQNKSHDMLGTADSKTGEATRQYGFGKINIATRSFRIEGHSFGRQYLS